MPMPMTKPSGRPAGVKVAALLLTALLAVSASLLFAGETHALSCPRGYHVRGLNCCRVVRGRAVCARNARLPNALAPLLADDAFLNRPIVIDGSDLSAEALSADGAYRVRPLATDARVLRPDDDVCESDNCRFDTIRALAAAHRDRADCLPALHAHYCRYSMWRDLDLEARLARILVLGRDFAEEYNLDVRIFPCIAAIETRYLEPLTVSERNCQGQISTSDQGLPQIIRPTFDFLYRDLGFRSRVVDYGTGDGAGESDGDGDGDDADLDATFANIGQSVRHQLELMAAVLANSGLNERRSNYQNALVNYNGSAHSLIYGQRVYACFTCLKERIDMTNLEMRGDPLRCLGAAAGGGDIRQAFAGFRASCE